MSIDSKAVQYFESKGWMETAKFADDHVILEVCPICANTNYKFYCNIAPEKEGSPADCKVCLWSGNLYKLRQELGDNQQKAEAPTELTSTATWGNDKKPDVLPNVAACYNRLINDIEALDYVMNTRGWSRNIIDELQLGMMEQRGKKFLVFPYLDANGHITFAKYRTLPPAEKAFFITKGHPTRLYNDTAIQPEMDELFVVEGECLSPDTELLTELGWVRSDNYDGQKVAQWSDTGVAEFVDPLAIVKKPYSGNMVRFTTSTASVDLLVTENHRTVYENRKGDVQVRAATDVPASGARFIRACTLTTQGVSLNEWEIRLAVAIQADFTLENGFADKEHYLSSGMDGWRGEFSKERKIARLALILEQCGIHYTRYQLRRGTTMFRFKTPLGRFTKEFGKGLYSMDAAQRSVFTDEIMLWDGHVSKRDRAMYNSVIKENADLVQWAFSMNGVYAKQSEYRRSFPRHSLFNVQVSLNRKRGDDRLTCALVSKTTNQYVGNVYCVKVPSSFIVTRRNGAVCITGNCDAITMLDMGVLHTVGVPGAGNKKTEWITKIDKARPKKIYILYDNDTAGQKGAEELAKKLMLNTELPTPLSIVLPPFQTYDGEEGKDISDWRRAGHTLEEFEALKKAALPFEVRGVATLLNALDRLDAELEGRDILTPRYVTQYESLNRKLGGFERGDVIDIIAEGKIGKTTFALNLIEHLVQKYNEPGLVECLEMPDTRLARKWVSMVTRTDDSPAQTPEDGHAKMIALKQAVVKAKQLASSREADLLFGYTQVKDPEEMYDTIRQAVRRYGVRFVVLDNIQLLADQTLKNQSHRTTHLSQISKKLKGLALELGVVLFRIVQPNRVRDGEIASHRNADGSSQIEKDCDAAVSLHRNAKMRLSASDLSDMKFVDEEMSFDPQLYAWVSITRYAPGGRCTLKFEGQYSLVTEWSGEEMAGFAKPVQTGLDMQTIAVPPSQY